MSNTNTPLHLAIQHGNTDIVKTLLASGCDLDARNADGLTPLDLAITSNNAEIVQLLLGHKDGIKVPLPKSDFPVPPLAPIPLTAEQRKQRITFWTTLYTVVLLLSTFITLLTGFMDLRAFSVSASLDELETAQSKTALINLILWLPLLTAELCCYFFFVLRLWEEIPREFARTTPKKAAWLSLIPFYAYYWMFIALLGLYKDMNKVTEAYGQGARFGTALIIAACTGWLFFGVHFQVFDLLTGFFTESSSGETLRDMLWSIAFCVFTVSMLWVIRKNVLDFINIKSSIETL
jgi:hypothetical protein